LKKTAYRERLSVEREQQLLTVGFRVVPGVSHIKKCDYLVKNMTDWRLEDDFSYATEQVLSNSFLTPPRVIASVEPRLAAWEKAQRFDQ